MDEKQVFSSIAILNRLSKNNKMKNLIKTPLPKSPLGTSHFKIYSPYLFPIILPFFLILSVFIGCFNTHSKDPSEKKDSNSNESMASLIDYKNALVKKAIINLSRNSINPNNVKNLVITGNSVDTLLYTYDGYGNIIQSISNIHTNNPAIDFKTMKFTDTGRMYSKEILTNTINSSGQMIHLDSKTNSSSWTSSQSNPMASKNKKNYSTHMEGDYSYKGRNLGSLIFKINSTASSKNFTIMDSILYSYSGGNDFPNQIVSIMGNFSKDLYSINYQDSNPVKIVYTSSGYMGQKGNSVTSLYEYDHKMPNNLSGSFQSLMGGIGNGIHFNVSHNLTKVTQTLEGANSFKNIFTFSYTYDEKGRPVSIQEIETTTNPDNGGSMNSPKQILLINTKLGY